MRDAFAPLRPPEGQGQEGGPKGLNALGVLAWHPELARAYNVFSGQVMYGSTLSARQRELLVLRVAAVRHSEYEWLQHVASAPGNGVEPAEVARVEEGPDAAGWSDLEQAMLRAVDELLGDALVSDETWSALAAELDERQLMDLVFTVGAYDVLAMALKTFGVPLDDDLQAP